MNLPTASGRGILTELIFHSPQVAGNLPIEIKTFHFLPLVGLWINILKDLNTDLMQIERR